MARHSYYWIGKGEGYFKAGEVRGNKFSRWGMREVKRRSGEGDSLSFGFFIT